MFAANRARARTAALFVFILFVAAYAPAVGAASSDGAMQVSADEFGLWDGSRLFVAQGNVTVRWRDVLITADTLRYDADGGRALFSGNVYYSDPEQELTGATLDYDLERGVAVLDGMEAVLHADGVDGPMFISGRRVRAADGEVRMERATLTTCECEGDVPAYRFVAKELDIFPGDRVIARSVTFYDHKVPLLYLPYLTLSLKEKTSRFDMPQIGYSERTGWYVKLTYNYVLKSGLYGALLFDYFQKLGPGAGLRHTYVDDDTGVGVLYAYGVGNGTGGADGSFSWERRWTGTPWNVSLRSAYDVAGTPGALERERLSGKLSLNRREREGSFSANAEFSVEQRANWTAPQTRWTGNGAFDRRFGDGWRLRLGGEAFDETRSGVRRRWLGYNGELQYAAAAYTLTGRVEQRVNPDYKEGDAVPWTHVSRLPELTLQLRRMAGFDIGFGLVRLKEEPHGTMAWRGETTVGLATRTWRLTPAVSLNVSGSGRGRAYTTNHQQLTLEGRASLNVQLARPLSATLQYNYRDVWGDTPFRFDAVRPAETFSPRLNWRSGGLTASAAITYNLLTERWGNMSVNATWRAGANLTLRASGTVDVYEPALQRVAGTVDWRPGDKSTLRLGGVYDFRREEWMTVHSDVQLSVGGGWEAGLTAIYDFAKESFSRSHMYVSHNACGCREIRLRYNHAEGEVWVEYHITAFPSSRVALGAGDDKLMFESDALADFLK